MAIQRNGHHDQHHGQHALQDDADVAEEHLAFPPDLARHHIQRAVSGAGDSRSDAGKQTGRELSTAYGAGNIQFTAITNTDPVRLDDLVGYEIQKTKLKENTEAFVAGRRANNCLLFGDSGTGKSTSIKALINEYYDRGLRMIEIYKHQMRLLPAVISEIKNRNTSSKPS